MNPELMRVAMEQMQRMTPEQMAAMQQQMAGMDPAMMRQQAAMLNNMSPEDIQRAQAQMASMDPASLGNVANQYGSYMSGQQQYLFNGASQLKAEGNRLHGAGKYAEALEKYERGARNLESLSTSAASDLRKACQLNAASCCLNLDRHDDCIAHCNAVLGAEPANRKALYRRGQAQLARGSYSIAVRDLSRALDLSPDNEREVVAAKLAAAKTKLEESGGSADGPIVEEVEEIAQAPPPRAAGADLLQANGSGGGAAAAVPTAEQLAQVAEVIKRDPEALKRAAESLRGMGPERLAAMQRASGAPAGAGFTPEMAAAAAEMMSSMSASEVERLAALASAAQGGSGVGGAPVAPAAGVGDAQAQVRAASQAVRENPDMLKQAAQMMQSMPPEQLEAMARASGMPEGMSISPEMLRMAGDMMSGMSPEDMERMAALAGSAGSGGGGGGGGAAGAAPMAGMPSPAAAMDDPATMDAMLEKMADPEMMASMQRMLGSMSPEGVAQLMSSSGMNVTPEQAAQMQGMLNKLSPTQLRMLTRATTMVSRSAMFAKRVRKALLSRWVLLMSLAILLIAVALRYYGLV